MDHDKLRTASSYLNNLLLARGLLRNPGEPIDFVKPSKDSRAQIINLVHDLILKEDRDREQREYVAVTLRNVRAEDARKNADIEKLKEKVEAAERKAVEAKAGERAAREDVKKVEKAMKALQTQAEKLKTSLAQVKAQCTNDVRKRDIEISRLKSHLQGQQRGKTVGVTAPSITITGGARARSRLDASVRGLDDPAYSLKQETTDFLTQLSQSLSDENDALIALIRGALGTMREVLGLPEMAQRQHPDSAIGSLHSNDDGKRPGSSNENGMVDALPTSYETLAADLEQALSHLKGILSNPNFVTLEEVEVRDEEIARLREGWERMESRWRDVLLMMQGWLHKINDGHTINLADLQRGMGLVSPVREHDRELLPAEPEQSFVSGEEPSEIRLPGISEADEGSSVLLEAPPTLSRSAKELAQSSPKRKRDVLEPPEFFDLRPASSRSQPAEPELSEAPYTDDAEAEEDLGPAMSLEDKLAAAQAEAEEAAAARAAAKARRREALQESQPRASGRKIASRRGEVVGLDGVVDGEENEDDTLGEMLKVSPVKKTKIRGRPKRRKSTLAPEELEELLLMGGAEEF